MARLRAPGGCPWDAEQTHHSLAVHLLEETYETLDAIDSGVAGDLREELGDLLLQIVFHSEIAQGSGTFDVVEVIDELVAKLVDRHPHVFGEVDVADPAQVVANWESIKRRSKGRATLAEGLPKGLPALVYAHKVIRRASGAGFAPEPSAGRVAELAGALGPRPADAAIGELLLEVVAVAGAAGVDPEGALRRQSDRLLRSAQEGAAQASNAGLPQ